MTPPTPEELLRLARKAWPDQPTAQPFHHSPDEAGLLGRHFERLIAVRHDRAREALHAALLVLSGELDVAAMARQLRELMDERDPRFEAGLRVGTERANADWREKSAQDAARIEQLEQQREENRTELADLAQRIFYARSCLHPRELAKLGLSAEAAEYVASVETVLRGVAVDGQPDVVELLAERDRLQHKLERAENVLLGASLAGDVRHAVVDTIQRILAEDP